MAGIGPLSDSGMALMIPILALCIPIVAILSSHQQKMASVFAQRNNGNQAEVDALRREVAELKSLAHQQAIAMDNLTQVVLGQAVSTKPDLQSRLSV